MNEKVIRLFGNSIQALKLAINASEEACEVSILGNFEAVKRP